MKKIKINVDREILPTSEILKKQDFNKLVRYVLATSESNFTPWYENTKGYVCLKTQQIILFEQPKDQMQ
jgi:hypothetical protein